MSRTSAGPRTVVVTGASAGIGRATALELVGRGHTVYAASRRERALDELRRAADPLGSGALRPVVLDVRDRSSHAALTAMLAQDGAEVDVLVNCAGAATAGPLLEATDEQVLAVFDTNALGLLALTQRLARPMIARGRGRVVNVSSTAGRFVAPMSGAYSASKFALEAVSDSLRLELAPLGVQVVVVEPGAVATGFAERSLEDLRIDPDGPYAALTEKVPQLLARSQAGATTPERVARVIARAVLSPRPRARYVTPPAARAVVALTALVPTRAQDALLRRVSSLTPSVLGVRRATPPTTPPAVPPTQPAAAGAVAERRRG